MLSKAVALMVLLILCPVLASRAGTQQCEGAKQRIYQITESEALQDPDSLQTVLALTAFVRDCEDEVSLDLERWLLINEVFSLDGLERYEEASDLVDRFFAHYFDSADDSYRARFYLWQLRFEAFSSNAVGVVVSYNEAKRYMDALGVSHRVLFHLSGSYAYREINEFEIALRLAEKAKTLIGEPTTYKDSLALAQAIHAEAEAMMRLGTRLPQVSADLDEAASLYGTLGDTTLLAVVTTLLGETYAAEGDTNLALLKMFEGVRLARRSGSERSEVYALYRRGQWLHASGDFESAEQSLSQALEASQHVREFDLRLLYALALLYEERRDYDRAASYYQAVIDEPQSSSDAEELGAARRAREGRIRLLLIEQERSQVLLWFALAGVLLLLGLVGVGFSYGHLRRRAIYDQLRESIVLPEHLKTGLSLRELERRFQKIVDSELLGKRLARIYAVLFDPVSVLDYIDDPYLAQVEAGSLVNNTALFECVAAVARAVENRTFMGIAANTMRSYLLSEFRKRSWEWPKNSLAWKRHFLEVHVKTLF